jgi:prepilin-type N-terminal cleavage/methylation domain-containing protein
MKRIRETMSCEKGFTLVELLVVIGIIGILAMMLLPQFSGMRDRARIASCQSNLKNLGTQVESFYADFERYPNATEWGNDFATLGIAKCPHDTSKYIYVPGGYFSDASLAGKKIFALATDLTDPKLAADATGRIDSYVIYCIMHDGLGKLDSAVDVNDNGGADSEAAETQLVLTQSGLERRPK